MSQRKPLSNSQMVCIALLWGVLCYLLITGYGALTPKVISIIVASGIIIFVPIYKQLRRRNK